MTKADKIKKIEKEVNNLTSSPLYTYRIDNNYLHVIGEGSLDAKILFVGEAPGRNEAKTGKPFCGAAGKILNELLKAAKINREDVYITNIIKDRPQKNRDPLPEEIELYGPFLDRQIEIIQPKVIVTLGRYAMGYIMKEYGLESELETIGKAHGKSYKADAIYGPINIIALYHPCMAIYNRSSLSTLKKDIKILSKYNK